MMLCFAISELIQMTTMRWRHSSHVDAPNLDPSSVIIIVTH